MPNSDAQPQRAEHDINAAAGQGQLLGVHAAGLHLRQASRGGALAHCGDQPSPGWLLRAALASCAVTRIALSAAEAGIALHTLEASAHSRSDARGLLGLPDSDGSPVPVGPVEVTMRVRIGANGIAPERLRLLVDQAIALSPVSQWLAQPVPVALQIEAGPGAPG